MPRPRAEQAEIERRIDRSSGEFCRVEPSRRALIELIRGHPGLDGVELTGVGWRYEIHGSLKKAEQDGVIEWRDGPAGDAAGKLGWYIKEKP